MGINQRKIFSMVWFVGKSQQIHAQFIEHFVAFVLVASSTGGHYVHPNVSATARNGNHMISREFLVFELFAAVQAKMLVAAEK